MKEKVIALIILALVVLSIAVNAIILDRNIDSTLCAVTELSMTDDTAYENARTIYSDFKTKEAYISITVNHEDLTNINECFADMIGYLSVGSSDDAEVAKYRLIDSLEHLKRSCGLNIDSII